MLNGVHQFQLEFPKEAGISWRGRCCLVTGGCGFGGAHLVRQLVERGAEVVVIDRSPPEGSSLDLLGLSRGVAYIRGDLSQPGLLRHVLFEFRIDYVFHLAAQPLVPLSIEQPRETMESNFHATLELLETLRDTRPQCGLVYASSAACYGATRERRPIPEDYAPQAFENPYAASKLAADALVRTYARCYGLRAVVCRFMNTYGPGDRNFSRLVPGAIRRLTEGRPYDFGDRDDGQTELDFLHVCDMTRAYLLAGLSLDTVSGHAINFGSGSPLSVDWVTRCVSRAFDGKERTPLFRGKRQRIPRRKSLDIGKARALLGWAPQIAPEMGLAGTVAWYCENWERVQAFAEASNETSPHEERRLEHSRLNGMAR